MEQRVEIVSGMVFTGAYKSNLDKRVKKLAKEGWCIAGIASAHMNGLLRSKMVATITFERQVAA